MPGFTLPTNKGHHRRPIHQSLPSIDDTTPTVGQTLNGIDATYDINANILRGWRVGGSGNDPVPGEVFSDYTVQPADDGLTIEYGTIGTSRGGIEVGAGVDSDGFVWSNPTSAVQAAAPNPPSVVTPPVHAAADLHAGSQDTWTDATWTSPNTFVGRNRQRFQSGAWADIPGATGIHYTFTGADVGCLIRGWEDRTNIIGIVVRAVSTPALGPILPATGAFDVTLTATPDNNPYAEVGHQVYTGVISQGNAALVGGITMTGGGGVYKLIQLTGTTFEIVVDIYTGGNPISAKTVTFHIDDGLAPGTVTKTLTPSATYDPTKHLVAWFEASAQGAGPWTTLTGHGTKAGSPVTTTMTANAAIPAGSLNSHTAFDMSASKRVVSTDAALAGLFAGDRACGGMVVIWNIPSAATHDIMCWRNPATPGAAGGVKKLFFRQAAPGLVYSCTTANDAGQTSAKGANGPQSPPAAGSYAAQMFRHNGAAATVHINRFPAYDRTADVATGPRTCTTCEFGASDGANFINTNVIGFGYFDETFDSDQFFRWAHDTYGTPCKTMAPYADPTGVDLDTVVSEHLHEDYPQKAQLYAPRGPTTWSFSGGNASIVDPQNWLPRSHSVANKSDTGHTGALGAELEYMVDPTGTGPSPALLPMSAYDLHSKSAEGWVMGARVTPPELSAIALGYTFIGSFATSLGWKHLPMGFVLFEGIRFPSSGRMGPFPAWWLMPLSGSYTMELDCTEQFGSQSDYIDVTGHGYTYPYSSVSAWAFCNDPVTATGTSGGGFRDAGPQDTGGRTAHIGFRKTYAGIQFLYRMRVMYTFSYGASQPAMVEHLDEAHYLLVNNAVGGGSSLGGDITQVKPADYPNAMKTKSVRILHENIAMPQPAPPTIGVYVAEAQAYFDACTTASASISNTNKLRAISDMIDRRKQVIRRNKGVHSANPWGRELWDVSIDTNWGGVKDMWLADKMTLAQSKIGVKGLATMTGGGSITMGANGWVMPGGGGAANCFDTGVSLVNDLRFGGSLPVSTTGFLIAGGGGYPHPAGATQSWPGTVLTGGHGTGALATVNVNTSGVVSSIVLTTPGSGYIPGDILAPSLSSGAGCQFYIYARGYDLGWALDIANVPSTPALLPIIGSGSNTAIKLSPTAFDINLRSLSTHEFNGAIWVKRLRGTGRFATCRKTKAVCVSYDDTGEIVHSGVISGGTQYVGVSAGNLIIGSYDTSTPGAAVDGLRYVECGMAFTDQNAWTVAAIMRQHRADMAAA